MGRWLEFVIVWLVALALPVQGIARTTMAHCGPSHARMHTVQPNSDRHALAAHHHGAHAAGSPHHHAATAGTTGHATAPDHAAALPDKLTDLGKYNCSACASCCSVCALSSSFPPIPAPEVAPTVFVTVVPSVAAFTTDGPDRPPRIGLA